MDKRILLPLVILPAFQTGNMQAADQPAKRPNIILFMVDDMGWEDTSLPFWTEKTHYNEVYETPNMERLARQGVMFTQAYASSISSPSRCSLITGTGDPSKGRSLFWNMPNNWGNDGPGINFNCAVRNGDWKLIYYYGTGKKELFNISDDIGEKNDLSTRHPEIVKRLSKELGDHLRKVDAQRPSFKATGKACPWPDEIN